MSDAQPGSNPAIWESEQTHPEQCNNLREALREITDPEIGLNIIQLGLIRNVKIDEDQAIVRMILTTPFCPYGPAMIEETRQRAEKALNLPVIMDLGLEPWDFSMMEEGLGEWGLY
ncbi:MAG: iron-sulfur cluster assembly protein [Anaerolinea sp.]|nr:iron-sulfur cluster assembly protein [Anaerolinea sp.]